MSSPSDIMLVQGDLTPPLPTSGKILFYAKTNGLFYSLNSAGVEQPIGGGGGGGSGTVTSISATGSNGVTIAGSPITTSGTLNIGLGNITPVSVTATGAISGSNLSGTNTGDQTITLTGDVTGSGTGSFAATLANSGVTAGTYGSSTQVPQITVDSKGRITSVTNVAISGGGGGSGVSQIVAGTGISISPTGGTGAVTINATGGGSYTLPPATSSVLGGVKIGSGINVTPDGTISAAPGAGTYETVVFRYTAGNAGTFASADAVYSTTSGVSVTITDPANCIVNYTFSGKTNPPKSIMTYGQIYSSNTFAMKSPVASANFYIAGGGASVFPDIANDIFTASNILTLQSRMTDTGANASVSQRAYLVVVFGF